MDQKELQRHTQAIYIDVEMTCWDGPPPIGMKQEMIEMGAVEVDLIHLEISHEQSYFVRPRRWDVSTKCTELTGITKADIQAASPFQDVLSEFINTFDPKGKMCGTWGDDADLVQQACQARGLKSPLRYLVDVGQLFQRCFLLKEKASLQKAVELLNLKFDGAPHSALADARNTALVHAEMIRRVRRLPDPRIIPTVEALEEASKSQFAEKLAASLTGLKRN